MKDLSTEILEHIGNRLKELNPDKPVKSRLKEEKNNASISELKIILEIIQKHQNEK